LRTLVVAVASCSDALELAPLWRGAAGPDWQLRTVWLGGAAVRPAAHSLGLPDDAVDGFTPAGAVAVRGGEVVLLAGHGQPSQRFGLAARHAGALLVRWNAGLRQHEPAHRDDAERRLTDHLAQFFCCTSEQQRDELRREGVPAAVIAVVGSLWPAALATLSPAGAADLPDAGASPYVWLALEHRRSVQDAAVLADLLGQLTAAAQSHGLAVFAAPTVLAPALTERGLALPPGLRLAELAAKAQVHAAQRARLIVTDSAGHQELAAALGVPCVVLQSATARPELVFAGSSWLAGLTAPLPLVLAQALQTKSPGTPYAAAESRLAPAMAQFLAAPAEACAPAASRAQALPSDGDHSGRTLGDDEAALAAVAVRSGTLNSTRGTFVAAFERRFADWLGRQHAIACANGSAAMHAALAALRLMPGDEVVTTPITDMGALTPILYEGAVPVFADVDPGSKNVTAATIEAQLTERTRAIVVTHLFGLPAELDAIVALAAERRIPLIEDCAQAFGATHRGRKVGTFGSLAAFSLQQGKHITSGEGGIVVTDDPELARRVLLFVNKAWGYGDPRPDHYFPALNYRLTELQGAVLVAQLRRLDAVVARRRDVADLLRRRLAHLPGLTLPADPPHGTHSYWKFAIDVDAAQVPGGAVALGRGLLDQGIACAPRYVQKPAYACELFTHWRDHPVTALPLGHNGRGRSAAPWPTTQQPLPGAVQALEQVLVLPLNERYLPQHCERVAAAIAARHAELRAAATPAATSPQPTGPLPASPQPAGPQPTSPQPTGPVRG
jgi:dTDP-4-amino-4,6-dideoxygalactose transaminase